MVDVQVCRTVIANRFAKLGGNSSKSLLTERCTFVPDAGALFYRFIAPIMDESVLNIFFNNFTNHPTILVRRKVGFSYKTISELRLDFSRKKH